ARGCRRGDPRGLQRRDPLPHPRRRRRAPRRRRARRAAHLDDAKVGDWVVTPRIGKPVEVQALWLNALCIGSGFSERWAALHARARRAFAARFWDEARGHLADVADVDHRPGTVDWTFRPNQIFAVGGLPFAVIEGEQ